MEEKYWKLREEMNQAHNQLRKKYTKENEIQYLRARHRFGTLCSQILEKLMEENSNILAKLK